MEKRHDEPGPGRTTCYSLTSRLFSQNASCYFGMVYNPIWKVSKGKINIHFQQVIFWYMGMWVACTIPSWDCEQFNLKMCLLRRVFSYFGQNLVQWEIVQGQWKSKIIGMTKTLTLHALPNHFCTMGSTSMWDTHFNCNELNCHSCMWLETCKCHIGLIRWTRPGSESIMNYFLIGQDVVAQKNRYQFWSEMCSMSKDVYWTNAHISPTISPWQWWMILEGKWF